uniref:RNA recognition motif 1 n=1 Tax=Guillardia theta TaxID=55529 RepID=A2AX49_GUITH|nr:RNA recognition motif 1 [Guillardia theta]
MNTISWSSLVLLVVASLGSLEEVNSDRACRSISSPLRLRGGFRGDDNQYDQGYGRDYGDRGGYRGRARGRGRGRGAPRGPPDGPIDPLKLFVGGLSWEVDDQQLMEAFQEFGNCEAKVMVDRYSGRSRGFGFVTFSEEHSAAKAIEEMNGRELLGRQITVTHARQKIYEQNSQSFDGQGGQGNADGLAGEEEPMENEES